MVIAYRVQVGSLSLSNLGRDARPLVAVEAELTIGGAGGSCWVELGDISWGEPALGDALVLELDVGEGLERVFTGEVVRLEQGAASYRIIARDALHRLARVEVEEAFRDTTAGAVVRRLIEAAGASAGRIDDGPSLPRYVVHRGPRALRHATRLAELTGSELRTDAEGKVDFVRVEASEPVLTLEWGKDLLELELVHEAATIDSFAVYGEGAAGSQGQEREHWLPTTLEGAEGEAEVVAGQAGRLGRASRGSTGPLKRTIIDAALRSSDDAQAVAAARATTLALRPLLGHVLALGRPSVRPGDVVELAGIPAQSTPTPGAAGRVLHARTRRVLHRFHAERGLLTRLDF